MTLVRRPHVFPRPYFIASFARPFSSKRSAENHDEDWPAAREWMAKLNPQTVPRSICEISFSRSSGPGGQNVNKFVPCLRSSVGMYLTLASNRVNSKAMIRVPLDSLFPLVPRVLHPQLLSSRYATQRTQSLVIQSDDSRKRAANVESCFDKLYQLLKTSAEDTIPGETSLEQKDRVRKLYGHILSFLPCSG